MLFRAFAAAIACGLWCAAAAAQIVTPAPFTKDQADSGREAFMTNCASCHGEHLTGISAPALVGETFKASWAKHTTSELYAFVQTTMPVCAGGMLPDRSYLEIVAFILQQNGAQPGPNAMSSQTDAKIADTIKSANAPAPGERH